MKAQRLGQGKGRVDLVWEVETEKPSAQSVNIRMRDVVLKVSNMDRVDSSRIGGDFSQTSLSGKEP